MIEFSNLPYLQKISYIFLWLQVVIATIGIFSNLLTFSVYMRKRMRKYSFSLYIKVMSITDSLTLLADYRHWAAFVFNANLDLVSSFFCSVGEYEPYVVAIITLWLLSLISLDRLITIAFPNRFSLLKNVYFQVGIIFCTVIYGFVSFIIMPLNYKIISVGNPNYTMIQLCTADLFYIQLASWINMANLVAVNLLLNNILNVFMIAVLFRSRGRLNQSSTRNHERKDRKFAVNAIGLNLTSTIFKLPLSIVLIVTNVTQFSIDEILVLFNVTVFIANIYSSASFFVNMFVNSVFCDEFLVMIKLKRANRVSWRTTQTPGDSSNITNNSTNHSRRNIISNPNKDV